MKIFFRHPSGAEFHLERQPLEKEKFYVLCGIAAGIVFAVMIISCVALR